MIFLKQNRYNMIKTEEVNKKTKDKYIGKWVRVFPGFFYAEKKINECLYSGKHLVIFENKDGHYYADCYEENQRASIMLLNAYAEYVIPNEILNCIDRYILDNKIHLKYT